MKKYLSFGRSPNCFPQMCKKEWFEGIANKNIYFSIQEKGKVLLTGALELKNWENDPTIELNNLNWFLIFRVLKYLMKKRVYQ